MYQKHVSGKLDFIYLLLHSDDLPIPQSKLEKMAMFHRQHYRRNEVFIPNVMIIIMFIISGCLHGPQGVIKREGNQVGKTGTKFYPDRELNQSGNMMFRIHTL